MPARKSEEDKRHEQLKNRLRTMTPQECLDLAKEAGIVDARGQLTAPYRDEEERSMPTAKAKRKSSKVAVVENGVTVEDRITKFRGVVTGMVTYITGCDQALVAPQGLNEKGEIRDSAWVDIQRLVVDTSVPKIVLDNTASPGPDKPAPKR